MPKVKIIKVVHNQDYDGEYDKFFEAEDDWEDISQYKYDQLYDFMWRYGKSKRQTTYVLVVKKDDQDELLTTDEFLTTDGFIEYGKKQKELDSKKEITREKRNKTNALKRKKKEEEKERLEFEKLSKKFRVTV